MERMFQAPRHRAHLMAACLVSSLAGLLLAHLAAQPAALGAALAGLLPLAAFALLHGAVRAAGKASARWAANTRFAREPVGPEVGQPHGPSAQTAPSAAFYGRLADTPGVYRSLDVGHPFHSSDGR